MTALLMVPLCTVLMWQTLHLQLILLLALVEAASSTVLRSSQVLAPLALAVSLAALGLQRALEVVSLWVAPIAVAVLECNLMLLSQRRHGYPRV